MYNSSIKYWIDNLNHPNVYMKICVFFINCSGDKPEIRRLKSSAVPSIFPWSQPPSVFAVQRKARAHRRVEKLCKEVCPDVGASECVETIGANESTENVESPILTINNLCDCRFTNESLTTFFYLKFYWRPSCCPLLYRAWKLRTVLLCFEYIRSSCNISMMDMM